MAGYGEEFIFFMFALFARVDIRICAKPGLDDTLFYERNGAGKVQVILPVSKFQPELRHIILPAGQCFYPLVQA